MIQPTLHDQLRDTVSAELADLLNLLAATVLSVGDLVRSAPFAAQDLKAVNAEYTENSTGDKVHRVDLAAHELISDALKSSPLVGCFASEEAPDLVLSQSSTTGPYCVVFDPLDGSNNLDCNGPVASIFGVFRRRTPVGEPCSEQDVLQAGTELIASGYALFSATTQFVLTTGDGVDIYNVDPQTHELRLSASKVQLPNPGQRLFSVNTGNTHKWRPAVQAYVEQLRQGGYKLRYTGTMAADVHRLLRYGGIYMHPADVTGDSARGKIRLLFEAIQLGFIIENAGGVATNAQQNILDCVPSHLHEQIPVVFGDPGEIARFSAHFGC